MFDVNDYIRDIKFNVQIDKDSIGNSVEEDVKKLKETLFNLRDILKMDYCIIVDKEHVRVMTEIK